MYSGHLQLLNFNQVEHHSFYTHDGGLPRILVLIVKCTHQEWDKKNVCHEHDGNPPRKLVFNLQK